MQEKEFQHTLKGCMKKLPALWYAVFSMKHLDEESTEIICRALKVSPSNFWVIIHRYSTMAIRGPSITALLKRIVFYPEDGDSFCVSDFEMDPELNYITMET